MSRAVPACIVLAIAAISTAAADVAAVPLYTNADLERFKVAEPSPTSPTPKAVEDPAAWTFVREFIDREYARIDADRQHEIDRRKADVETEQPESYGTPYYGLGYYGYGYHGYGSDGDGVRQRKCPRPSGARPAHAPAAHRRTVVVGKPIVPIHAR